MPSSPQTPRHSRHPSNIDVSYQYSSASSSPQARRQSKSSFQEPLTPLRNSMNESDLGGFSGAGIIPENGLGNLADELADAFSESGDEGEYYENGERVPEINCGIDEGDSQGGPEGVRDSGIDVANNLNGDQRPNKTATLNLPVGNPRGHRRKGSEYDGSEYGSDSDFESPGMPAGLVSKISAVEALARRGTESSGGPNDGVFDRVIQGLKELGSQTSMESSATRLITAHNALSTHMDHQARQLRSFTFPLTSRLGQPLEEELIDELLPMLLSLSDSMPRPATTAFQSLAALHSITSDLIQTLNYLSDTLHMSRQTTTTATRRLRAAKEMVADIQQERRLAEEGEQWITDGNWGERLKTRECAGVCGEVIGGFEEVCNGWRARLLAQAESAPA